MNTADITVETNGTVTFAVLVQLNRSRHVFKSINYPNPQQVEIESKSKQNLEIESKI